jgi:hypothetical protein
LQIIKTLGPTAMNQFYRALVITGQDALAELLTTPEKVKPMTDIEKSDAIVKYSR